jgi:2-hydroxycyclohexanecarboxyl-CoA dehydrogenase
LTGLAQQGLDVSGRAYVVTGAGSGINLTITRALLAAGCRVAAWDVSPGALEGERHGLLSFTRVDVRDKAALAREAAAVASAAGGFAGLVAGAGVMQHAPFLEIKEADFDRTLAINLKGAMLTVQAVLPHMKSARRGSIVMFASMLARSGGANAADYIASKGGVLGLARSVALEVADAGIRVNTISPAVIDTPMPQAVYSRETLAARGRDSPMGRLATVDDVAAAALFLLSDDASFMTGQDIRINGGQRLF